MKKHKKIFFPTLEEALYLHKILIQRYGGSLGVRDLGLLQSALVRPQSGYYGSLSLQAAALLQSIVCNHALRDGNKRTGFAITAVFLGNNGYLFRCTVDDGIKFLIESIITAKVDVAEIAAWLESRMIVSKSQL